MSSGLLDWFRKERQHDGGGRSLAVIGLGNPGPRYADTRHNAGFMCIDLLASRLGIKLDDKRKTAVLGEGWLDGRRVVLVKPRTFVNRSGEAVKYVLDRHRISHGSLLIVLDDLDLAVGGIRLRAAGGSGGHNGLNSINDSLGTNAYSRLRIGIGRPKADTVGHVLTKFEDDESPLLRESLERAAGAAEAWLREGIEFAMNHYN